MAPTDQMASNHGVAAKADFYWALGWIIAGGTIIHGGWTMDRLERLNINPYTAPGPSSVRSGSQKYSPSCRSGMARPIIREFGSHLPRLSDVWRYRRTVVRSGIIGTFVGIVPGVGEDVAAWSSYAAARRASKERELSGLALVRPFLKILQIPREIIMPIVFVLCVIGAFAICLATVLLNVKVVQSGLTRAWGLITRKG